MSHARGSAPEVTLVVSIDTEEDHWAPTRSSPSARNILELPRLDALFRRLGGVRATYFTTHAVAQHSDAVDVLRGIHEDGLAEIGAHLHPWNTPPLSEPALARNTMLKNLAPQLQLSKLEVLTEALAKAFGARPRSFRAGRYGLGPGTLPALIECGYAVDSSVTPFVSWEDQDDGPNFVGAPLHPYRLSALSPDPRVPDPLGQLLEIPLSCGFSRAPFHWWSRVWESIGAPGLRPLRLRGALARSGLVRPVFLNPEVATAPDMLTCSRFLVAQGLRYLQLTLHSPSLTPGLSPFVATTAHRDRLFDSIERFVEGLAATATVRFATVSEAGARADELVAQSPLFADTHASG